MSEYTVEDVNDYINLINDILKEDNQEELNIPESSITPEAADALGGSLRSIYRNLQDKRDREFEEKQKQQRYERGYADSDVWNMDAWFINIVRPMLQQLRNEHQSSPGRLVEDEEGDCHEKWDEILDHMIFLLGEMDEDSCSKQNKYQDAWWKAYEEFEAKYGFGGEGLKSDEERAKEKAEGVKRFYFPSDEPGRDDVKELTNKWMEEEKSLAVYRDQCKNEFFDLFSEYFWDLWD